MAIAMIAKTSKELATVKMRLSRPRLILNINYFLISSLILAATWEGVKLALTR